MAKKSNGSTTALAVLVTLAVAGSGGYMIGNRAGLNSANLETATVVTVNGDKITKNDLYDIMVKVSGEQVAAELIDKLLVDQAAKKAGVTVTTAEVDAEVNKVKEQIGGEAQFLQALAYNQLSLDQFRLYQEMNLKATKVLSKDINLDDAALQKYFDEHKSQFDQRQLHARHILVDTEEEANAIKAELDKGADFAALAKEKSIEPAAAESGGDLGTFGRGRMVGEFEQVVFSLAVNEISKPFKSDFGWHIAQVLEITGSAPDFQSMKADVKEAAIQSEVTDKLGPWLDDLRDKANIKNSLDTTAM